jgi:hypothetical protein
LAVILSARRFRSSVGRIDVDVRFEQEDVDAIEPGAVDLGLGGQIEHGVEVDAGFGAGTAFADEAGPHGVVKLGEVVGLAGHDDPFALNIDTVRRSRCFVHPRDDWP